MTPAEVAALLRIKQARERRMRAGLDAANRAGREAAGAREAAEQNRQDFAAKAQQARADAYGRIAEATSLRAWTLQASVADLAGLRAHEAKLASLARRAAAHEIDAREAAEQAARRHAAAQRGAEAFGELKKQVRAAADAAAETAEEAEAEEPRRPPHAR